VLADGSKLVLRGTNDVDSGQRGVAVSVPGLGVVDVSWRQVERVTFDPPPASPGYDAFDGGGPIRGTVTTIDGRRLAGEVTWDRDETHSWETLEGGSEGVRYVVPFAHLRSIERQRTAGGVRAVLRDGRTLVLEGTNDVDDSNRGLVVRTDAGQVDVDWTSFDRIDLD
jgi:hypothetical protein